MKKRIRLSVLIMFGMVISLNSLAQDPNFHIYLCFGQSNMEGTGVIESQDRVTNARVRVLADQTCSNLNRTYGTWYVAAPPLNRCYSGLGIADYFGKTMANSTNSAITIGLVPASVGGSDIALFQKSAPIGRGGADIPPQFNGGYAWLLDLARKAQQAGVIKGIIFHQGETNTNDPNWKYKVQEIVNNLRSDLNIGNVPFLAGELLYAQYNSCCSSHNVEVNKLPGLLANCSVISANGLPGADNAHFTSAAYRDYGGRYAQKMLTLVNTNVAGSTTLGTGRYRITARHSGKVLDVAGASTADGGDVTQYTSSGNTNQQWTVTSLGSGQYSIRAVHSGKALDVVNNSTADGADINQWYYSGGNNQKWRIESVGSGYYRIVSVNSGKCIDIPGSSTADGVAINQWGCNGGNNQQFQFAYLGSARAGSGEPVSLEEVAEVYPNPSAGSFTLRKSGAFTYDVSDVSGKVLQNGQGVDQATVGSNLTPGFYLLKVKGEKGIQTLKLLKQ